MAPVKNYFSEERMEKNREKNAQAIGRISERNRKRMQDAIEQFSVRQIQHKTVMTDRIRLQILNLYLEGNNCNVIAQMLDAPRETVFKELQMPLLRYLCGARHIGVFYHDPEHRVLPREEIILTELENLGMEPPDFAKMVREKTGCGCRTANRLWKDNKCAVPLQVAAGVSELLHICADRLFIPKEKEKAAE